MTRLTEAAQVLVVASLWENGIISENLTTSELLTMEFVLGVILCLFEGIRRGYCIEKCKSHWYFIKSIKIKTLKDYFNFFNHVMELPCHSAKHVSNSYGDNLITTTLFCRRNILLDYLLCIVNYYVCCIKINIENKNKC